MKQFLLILLTFLHIKEFSFAETTTSENKYLNDINYYKSGVNFYENGEFKKSFIVFFNLAEKGIKMQFLIYQICILRVSEPPKILASH